MKRAVQETARFYSTEVPMVDGLPCCNDSCEAVQIPPPLMPACQSANPSRNDSLDALFQKTKNAVSSAPLPDALPPCRCAVRSAGPAGRDACPTPSLPNRVAFVICLKPEHCVHQTSPCKTMNCYPLKKNDELLQYIVLTQKSQFQRQVFQQGPCDLM